MFVNYLTYPHKSSKHVAPIEAPIDFHNRRVLMTEGCADYAISLTTVQDLANVVARAVEYHGEWPVVGGIRGSHVTVGQLIAIGERVRGSCPALIRRVNI